MLRYIINERLVNKPDATIHVSDLGLLRGYGVFDFFRLSGLHPVFLEDHLDRFFRSASRLSLTCPVSREQLKLRIEEMIDHNRLENSGVRIVLTGGPSPDGYTIGDPTLLGINEPISMPREDLLRDGIKVIPHPYLRDIPDVKTLNYVIGIYNRNETESSGAMDLLFHWNGQVSELTRSNFYIVTQSGTVVTPDKGILPGITRKHILKVASREFDVEERAVHLDEVYAAKECFITGTTKTVMPVVQVGSHVIGNGQRGACTRRLQVLFAEVVNNTVGNRDRA